MAEEQDFQVSAEPTIYFYVNNETEMVDYISMYSIFGITVRPKGKKWTSGTRSDLDPYYNSNYEIWSYDWSNEDDTPGSGADLEPDDDESWEIEPVQRWGRGEDLDKADVESYANLVVSGDSYISKEEAEKIPGE